MKRLNEDNRTFAYFRLVIDDKFVKHTFEIALCNNSEKFEFIYLLE